MPPVKNIGAGFGRTGATRLKFALEQLGFNLCCHMIKVVARPRHTAFWQAALLT
jgi:hypothetical protein